MTKNNTSKTVTTPKCDSETNPNEFWVIGEKYFIRTVTFHYTGELSSISPSELCFTKAAWIADSGRFQQAIESCSFSEVEMYPSKSTVMIGRGGIVDAVRIETLPTCQK